MGATFYFDQPVQDQSGQSEDINFEMGASSLDIGNRLGCLFFKVDGKEYFLDDETGEKLFNAFLAAGRYLGYKEN